MLADTEQAGALFLVTEDVDDFAPADLSTLGVSAVSPDLFLSVRVTDAGYREALDFIVGFSHDPRVTPEDLHVRLGRAHPLTVQAHSEAFGSAAMAATHNPPVVLYRGKRCLRCLLNSATVTQHGVCENCEPLVARRP